MGQEVCAVERRGARGAPAGLPACYSGQCLVRSGEAAGGSPARRRALAETLEAIHLVITALVAYGVLRINSKFDHLKGRVDEQGAQIRTLTLRKP